MKILECMGKNSTVFAQTLVSVSGSHKLFHLFLNIHSFPQPHPLFKLCKNPTAYAPFSLLQSLRVKRKKNCWVVTKIADREVPFASLT